MGIFNLFKSKIYKVEAEMAALNISTDLKSGSLSPETLVVNAETIVIEYLRNIGINEKLSSDQYKNICQMAVLFAQGNNIKKIEDLKKIFK
ncbi:hypothetical protein N9I63_01400 [Hyphomicrobiales bacterium]|nr:hypothetical protein [Hyphomicrobiales bacterium]